MSRELDDSLERLVEAAGKGALRALLDSGDVAPFHKDCIGNGDMGCDVVKALLPVLRSLAAAVREEMAERCAKEAELADNTVIFSRPGSLVENAKDDIAEGCQAVLLEQTSATLSDLRSQVERLTQERDEQHAMVARFDALRADAEADHARLLALIEEAADDMAYLPAPEIAARLRAVLEDRK